MGFLSHDGVPSGLPLGKEDDEMDRVQYSVVSPEQSSERRGAGVGRSVAASGVRVSPQQMQILLPLSQHTQQTGGKRERRGEGRKRKYDSLLVRDKSRR